MPEIKNGDEFSLEDGTLRCPFDMNRFAPKELREWVRKLLEEPGKKLTIDLSETKYLASHHLGMLSEAWTRALDEGKELLVVISPDLRRLFELSGFDQVFNMVVKPGP